MAFPSPWLNILHARSSTTIQEYEQPWDVDECEPALIALVGKTLKSDVLRQLIRDEINKGLLDPHGQVYLWKDPSNTALLYVDCELHSTTETPGLVGIGPPVTRIANWQGSSDGPYTRRRVGHLLTNRVISPLCNVVCYFASDLGGMRSVASLLVSLVLEPRVTDNRHESLPRVLIVVETSAKSFDEHVCENSIIEMMGAIAKSRADAVDVTALVARHFNQLRVIGIRSPTSSRERGRQIRTRLFGMLRESRTAQRNGGILYRRDHVRAFAGKLLDHFCLDHRLEFSFISSSRPLNFTANEFPVHLHELFSLLPSEAWTWHLACPLIASAIMHATYPPDSPRIPIMTVYRKIFRSYCNKAIYDSFVHKSTCSEVIKTLECAVEHCYQNFPSLATYKDIHYERLVELQPYLAQVRTHKTCLCCLMRRPEKMLSCGHVVCDTCIRTFGVRSKDMKYRFSLTNCMLCGLPHSGKPFDLTPPTAGIRLLAVDGGGVRGIIPLAMLRQVEFAFKSLSVPLTGLFDFVCGSSAGGLIVIGLFLMRWDCDEAIQKFEELAAGTFRRQEHRFSGLRNLHRLASSYIRDGQYSTSAIERAFQTSLNGEISMFNPLSSDTKVAVTTTTAKDTRPCLLTNYNGGERPSDLGYIVVRADRPEHDVSVSHAASCTSAAPWFFQPKAVEHLGTFQDGGLLHNNPLNLTLWETKFIWPHKPSPDFVLSLGTGYSEALRSRFSLGPQTPVKDRFIARIFKTFMHNLDGEKIWRDCYNGLSEGVKHRFHRLNLKIDGSLPALDDVASMGVLREQATIYSQSESTIRPVLDSIYASMFYFEFEQAPVFTGTSFFCVGHILCRVALPLVGRRLFYRQLRDCSSYFLIMGRPVPCIEKVSSGIPLFRRRVTFELKDLEEPVAVTIRGITSNPCTISGLPRSARELLKLQGLDAPFGVSDHSLVAKMLPKIPGKRKRSGGSND